MTDTNKAKETTTTTSTIAQDSSEIFDTYKQGVLKVTEEVKMAEPRFNADGTKDSIFAFNYYKAHFFDNIDLNGVDFDRNAIVVPKLASALDRLDQHRTWITGEVRAIETTHGAGKLRPDPAAAVVDTPDVDVGPVSQNDSPVAVVGGK